jgi:multisubunit Na+/H+ antiporter MnhC subunit
LANQDDITPPVVNTEVVNPQSNSGLIVGMSIISFGLILLLLGLGIRTKEDEFEVQIKVNEKIDDKSGLPA